MADIVKLIYKGDEMAQWWGSGDSNMAVVNMVWYEDTTAAQAIVDAALAGKFVISLFKERENALATYCYFLERRLKSGSSSPENDWWLMMRRLPYSTWSWSTQEHVAWTQTWYYLASMNFTIEYTWWVVTRIQQSQTDWNQIWISWYTDPE